MMSTQKTDEIKEPTHYKVHAMECIDEMALVFGLDAVITFCKLNAWKYRYRAGHKGDAQKDLDKADQYLRMAKRFQCQKGDKNE